MTDLTARGPTGYDTEPMPEVEGEPPGELRLATGSIQVGPTEQHAGPRNPPVSQLGGSPGGAEQPERPSLDGRTVPGAQARGALGGALAAIGAAVGSIVPGAGTAVGAVVGAVVAGAFAVGARIGRAVGLGRARDRAEKLINGLLNDNKITLAEATRLKEMSDADLNALVSISKRKTGIRTKAERDAIRREVLMTAAEAGLDEAKRVKAQFLTPIDLGPDGGWPRDVAAAATMPESERQGIVEHIVTNLETSSPRSVDGLAERFWDDTMRGTRTTVVHSATDTAELTAQGNPQAELERLVGSDTAAYHLSKFLSQTPFNSLLFASALAIKDKDGNYVLPSPGQERTDHVTLRRRGDIIDMDFAMEGSLDGLGSAAGAFRAQEGSHFSGKMRLQIPLADLESGNVGAFRMVESPRFLLRASVEPL